MTTVNAFTTACPSSTLIPSRVVFHEDDYTHPCHPLYVHPSNVLGSFLVSESFNGTCYGSWRRIILVKLSVRRKLDFINGGLGRPPKGSPLVRQ